MDPAGLSFLILQSQATSVSSFSASLLPQLSKTLRVEYHWTNLNHMTIPEQTSVVQMNCATWSGVNYTFTHETQG